jgi:hypothetical protein
MENLLENDMNDEQLSRALERIAEKAVPDGSSIWDKLETAYQAEAKPKRIAIRMNWAAVFVAIIGISLLTTGGALAYILLTRFPADAGGQNVANAGLGIAINESQTVNGVTINLVQAYADEQRILLFYTLEGVDPTHFNHRAPDAALSEVWTLDGIDQYQSIDPLHYQYRRDEGRVLLVSSIRNEAVRGENLEFRWQLIINDLGEVAPPEFHFDLSLPVVESLTIPVKQSVEADGLTVTLQSIEITAASTIVTVCTMLPDSYDHADFNDLGLLIDGDLYGYEYGTEQNIFEGQHYCMSQGFNAGMLRGTETIEVTVSGIFIAPTPNQTDIDSAIAELEAVEIEAEIALVDGHIEWKVLSNAQNYNTEVWLSSTLYDYEQVEINHRFSVNLSEIVLANR